ncbi:DUF779 domain-containing protein [Celeribacter arenosi]|uniref:DUF779 domain-containing protein n=1 Tax=Celeribacter arenosi TaxID=792649 RepID=A0ABP7K1P6_9RHOB
MIPDRVIATADARALLARIVAQNGAVMFHQSGGCCDGSAPMCYPVGEFPLGPHDVQLGVIDGADFWMSGAQFEVWKHTQIILASAPGSGAAFSLDNGGSERFVIQSRVFSDAEMDQLKI